MHKNIVKIECLSVDVDKQQMFRGLIRFYSSRGQDFCYTARHTKLSALCAKHLTRQDRFCRNVRISGSYFCHVHGSRDKNHKATVGIMYMVHENKNDLLYTDN